LYAGLALSGNDLEFAQAAIDAMVNQKSLHILVPYTNYRKSEYTDEEIKQWGKQAYIYCTFNVLCRLQRHCFNIIPTIVY
jgi:hypothetical protein